MELLTRTEAKKADRKYRKQLLAILFDKEGKVNGRMTPRIIAAIDNELKLVDERLK